MTTRDEILAKLMAVLEHVGAEVSFARFRQMAGVSERQVYRHWGDWKSLRQAAGLSRRVRPGTVYSDEELLAELNRVGQLCGEFPSDREFDRHSESCWGTIQHRFGRRLAVWERYREWLTQQPAEARPDYLREVALDADPASIAGVTDHKSPEERQRAIDAYNEQLLYLTPALLGPPPPGWPGTAGSCGLRDGLGVDATFRGGRHTRPGCGLRDGLDMDATFRGGRHTRPGCGLRDGLDVDATFRGVEDPQPDPVQQRAAGAGDGEQTCPSRTPGVPPVTGEIAELVAAPERGVTPAARAAIVNPVTELTPEEWNEFYNHPKAVPIVDIGAGLFPWVHRLKDPKDPRPNPPPWEFGMGDAGERGGGGLPPTARRGLRED